MISCNLRQYFVQNRGSDYRIELNVKEREGHFHKDGLRYANVEDFSSNPDTASFMVAPKKKNPDDQECELGRVIANDALIPLVHLQEPVRSEKRLQSQDCRKTSSCNDEKVPQIELWMHMEYSALPGKAIRRMGSEDR